MIDALSAYEALTGYPLTQLLDKTGAFLRDQAPVLRRAFEAGAGSGGVAAPPQLKRLLYLRQELTTTIARLPALDVPQLPGWELLELLEDLVRSLTSLEQLPRYLRLPESTAAPTYTTSRHQTLEQVAALAGQADPGQAWAQLALANDLGEEDYSPAGGTQLSLGVLRPGGAAAGRILAVLGPQNGLLALGTDLARGLTLDAESQDLLCLTPDETADQTLEVLLGGIRRGSLPWAPWLGPRYDLLVGANQNLLGLPTVLRQLADLLATDDTITSFQLTGVRTERDLLYLDLSVRFAAGADRNYALKSI